MKQINLYIADVDASFIRGLSDRIQRRPDMKIVGAAGNGRVALDQIQVLRPDAIVTDVLLPEIDGISLVRACGNLPNPPVCIVCTRFYSEPCIEQISGSGAAYILIKPVDGERLLSILGECCRHIKSTPATARAERAGEDRRQSAMLIIQSIMLDLGISARLAGSVYFVEACLLLRDNPMLIRNLNQGLYRLISERMDTTPPRVERALRSAIAVAYGRGGMKRRFSARPTNREILEYAVNRMREEAHFE